MLVHCSFFFFFNDTATTEIYTLSLHDALPISTSARGISSGGFNGCATRQRSWRRQRAKISAGGIDRKSTRLKSSHLVISYAVFCLKKKKTEKCMQRTSTTRRPLSIRDQAIIPH